MRPTAGIHSIKLQPPGVERQWVLNPSWCIPRRLRRDDAVVGAPSGAMLLMLAGDGTKGIAPEGAPTREAIPRPLGRGGSFAACSRGNGCIAHICRTGRGTAWRQDMGRGVASSGVAWVRSDCRAAWQDVVSMPRRQWSDRMGPDRASAVQPGGVLHSPHLNAPPGAHDTVPGWHRGSESVHASGETRAKYPAAGPGNSCMPMRRRAEAPLIRSTADSCAKRLAPGASRPIGWLRQPAPPRAGCRRLRPTR